jgi:hypothetical protein
MSEIKKKLNDFQSKFRRKVGTSKIHIKLKNKSFESK